MFDVTMPKLTDSMEEGRIVEWKVSAGQRVREGELLAEIETDKAVMELESFRSGVVAEIVCAAGEVVPVGTVIARIGEGEEAGSEAPRAEPAPEGRTEEPAGVHPAPAPGQAAARPPAPRTDAGQGAAPATPDSAGVEREEAGPGPAVPLPGAHPLAERGNRHSPRPSRPQEPAGEAVTGTVKASPRARRLARDKGLDLTALHGTGPEGRITTADVEAAASGRASREGTPRPGAAADELPPIAFTEGEAAFEEVGFYQRAAIRRVVASARGIPHFYVRRTVRAEALLARRAEEKDASGATVTHLLLRACALALGKVPEANRSYDRGRWVRWRVINLGLAIQTGQGLAVGVLRDAGKEDLAGITRRTRDLVERARQGRLSAAERANASFTLSNLGAFDVESFSAIINPPSALTLAVGSARDAPVVQDGAPAVGKVLHLTLSCDHRVVDGVLAARFLGEVSRVLEDPEDLR